MAAPADNSRSTSTTAAAAIAGEDEAPPPLLPRAIQLVMEISSRWKSSTSTSSTETIGDIEGPPLILWIKLVFLPLIFIAGAAAITQAELSDSAYYLGQAGQDVISRAGGSVLLAAPNLLLVYMAVLQAAEGHLGFFAPRMPFAALEAFGVVGYGIGVATILPMTGVLVLVGCVNQAWPLLVAWTLLAGLLVAAVIAFWLCLLRTYGGERRRREKSCCSCSCSCSCGEAVIDGLAYLYSRLLYECVVRFPNGAGAYDDAHASMQQQLDDAHLRTSLLV